MSKKLKQESNNKQRPKKTNIQLLEEDFKKKLIKKNYVLHLVARDGNCLFSSISDQVYGTDKHSAIIREKCMDFIEKNSVFYSQFIEGGEKQIPAYIKRKRKKGIWGDNLEIQALSEIYQRPIEIYINVHQPINSFGNTGKNKNKFPIKISYHGNKHYNSMVPSVKNKDFSLFKKELINNNQVGKYETEFIQNYDPNEKFLDYGGLNNNIDLDANIEYIDFNEEDFQENNINITNKENIDEIDKNEEEYLKNPIIQNALELGFDLVEAINALKICGENQDIVINYLYDSQN
jgi:hypothetical protein